MAWKQEKVSTTVIIVEKFRWKDWLVADRPTANKQSGLLFSRTIYQTVEIVNYEFQFISSLATSLVFVVWRCKKNLGWYSSSQ